MSAVDSIISQAQDIADTHSSKATDAINQALGIAGGGTSMTFPSLNLPTPQTPDELHVKNHQSFGVYIPETVNPAEIYNQFNQTYDPLYAKGVAGLANFIAAYFPRTTAFEAAQTWLEQTIATGGANFTSVENQFWANARNRSAQEEQRTLRKLADEFQGDFPAPPGAYSMAVRETMLEFKRTQEERNNEVAIKHIEYALDLIKFATDKAISLRTQSLALAMDYIKALMEPADIASRFVFQTGGLQAQLIHAVGGYYGALLDKDKLLLETARTKAELDKDYTAIGIQLAQVDVAKRADAAIGAANAAAEVAKGALSSLNAIASYTQSV